MSHACYVLGAWGVTLASVALYAVTLMIRGRRMMRRLRDHPDQPGR
ncbi:MAG: heme exporter protein CcmD [Acidimicrobiaceae bacterium]|nr:heme exporter protein CcmD [Acidimicrobiaceae bacterium]MCY4293288.1 heme exporter protein CcmD [Acidimicrobiaceae bacterium]